MHALTIIKSEHRNLAAVLFSMEHLIGEIESGKHPDFAIFHGLFTYIDRFLDQYHHPKEDEYLFKILRQRTDEVDGVLSELEQEHARFEGLLIVLEQALRGYDQGYPKGLDVLEKRVGEYLEFQWQHMRKEEEQILPIAEKAFRDEDWAAMNNAFLRHDDPMFGENVRAGFEALRNRIVKDTDSRPSG